MRFYKKTAFTAFISALPFVFLASWLWIDARTPSVFSDVPYLLGDIIFQLGFPLTTTIFVVHLGLFGKFSKENELWLIPIISLVFIIQWIIWSQVIMFIYARRTKLK